MRLYITIFFTTLFFIGCGGATQNTYNTQNNNIPQWLTNPNFIKNKISAVGSAGIHYKGKSEQRKLAISRAIDQIALQKKTTVSNQTIRESSKGHLQTSKTHSLQSTNNISLSTKVIEEYNDIYNNKLYVLVIEK